MRWLGPFTIVGSLGRGLYRLHKIGTEEVIPRVNGARLTAYNVWDQLLYHNFYFPALLLICSMMSTQLPVMTLVPVMVQVLVMNFQCHFLSHNTESLNWYVISASKIILLDS